MLKVGIVGLPNAGKSTLFNSLVSQPKAGVAAYPFTTIDKNIGAVNVPDTTLFDLAKIENISKVTPTTITFVDIAGLIKGAHQGEGLGNQFLHHIREVDLIFHLVRFFKDENVAHVHAKIDPEEDIDIVNEELLLTDLQTLNKKLEKSTTSKITEDEATIIRNLKEKLNQGIMAVNIPIDDKEKEFIDSLNLLTAKKQLYVANIDEDDIKNPPKIIKGKPALSVCAKLEAELAELPWVEQQKFLKEYGLPKSAKEKIIIEAYHALDIITFYTIAKRTEGRAWTLRRGDNAVTAAGKIHTDFVQHFVKAEAINAQQLIKTGSWHKAHEAGKIVLHGKDYIVQNQDVLEFKVSLKS